MKRMCNKARILCLLTLLLLVAYPFSVLCHVEYERGGWHVGVWNGQVRLYVTWNQLYINGRRAFQKGWESHQSTKPKLDLIPEFLWGTHGRRFGMPLWIPLLLLAVFPMYSYSRCRRRRKRNLCIHCGYNLTGLPEPKCPECGKET
ncbi:MAG: hypothetical protein DHS20C16_14390 [Phycisphaerae bacterium]|nr:MAG: hypothetical protein DHS20C16_14390 [Phycisphaerae bacterium]